MRSLRSRFCCWSWMLPWCGVWHWILSRGLPQRGLLATQGSIDVLPRTWTELLSGEYYSSGMCANEKQRIGLRNTKEVNGRKHWKTSQKWLNVASLRYLYNFHDTNCTMADNDTARENWLRNKNTWSVLMHLRFNQHEELHWPTCFEKNDECCEIFRWWFVTNRICSITSIFWQIQMISMYGWKTAGYGRNELVSVESKMSNDGGDTILSHSKAAASVSIYESAQHPYIRSDIM